MTDTDLQSRARRHAEETGHEEDPTIDDKAQEEDEQEEGQGQGHEREPEGVMFRISPPTYQDDLCERRRQQNREAQRRFRLKKAKEREAETHTQLAPIPNALSTTSHPINHVVRAPIRYDESCDLLLSPSSISAHGMAVPQENASTSPSSEPMTTPVFGMHYQDCLGQNFTLGLNTSLPSLGFDFDNLDDLTSGSQSLVGCASSKHDQVHQSVSADMDGSASDDCAWLDDHELALLFRDNQLQQLPKEQHEVTWPDQQSTFALPDIDETRQAPSHSSSTPVPQQLRSSHDLSNSLVIDGSYEHRPSLHQTPSDTTPPGSRQERSSTTPKILSPSQRPQPQVSVGPTIYPAFDPQQSLLHMAIESGHEGIVRILLEEGVDINEGNSEGSTALHMTVQKRQENMLQLLLEKGANVDIADDKGRKPVHLAIASDFQTGLRLLLRHKAATSFTTAQA
ncbi:hypothetical protein D6C95_00875 [Aureobasidium pullulans]|nr:hypothetical protein D6C95_00875 [Aureobasidium pullulans]